MIYWAQRKLGHANKKQIKLIKYIIIFWYVLIYSLYTSIRISVTHINKILKCIEFSTGKADIHSDIEEDVTIIYTQSDFI